MNPTQHIFFYKYAGEPKLNKFSGVMLQQFYDIMKLRSIWCNAGASRINLKLK